MNADSIAGMGALAAARGRRVDDPVDEGVCNDLAVQHEDRVRSRAMAAYNESVSRYTSVYRRLAE
jgi:hypothetical protein